MRLACSPSLAVVTCVFAALAACGRGPIGGELPNKRDAATDAADASGRAGSNGTGAAGTTGAAGKPSTGAAGAFPTGSGGASATGMAGGPMTGSAGVTGAAGTTAAAGTTGTAGTTAAVCMPGATMCAGPSYVYSCLPTGVWSSELTGCSLGCFQGLCRQCSPGDSMCNSTTTVQLCQADGLRWAPPLPCDNGCENGRCAPRCQPGFGECVTGQDARTCLAGGIWSATINCQHGCWNGACNECEPFSAMCLTTKTGRRCQDDGKWSAPHTCLGECSNGVCSDCEPGLQFCADDKSVRTCSDNGTWNAPVPCDTTVCFSDSCRTCRPGSTQCVSGDTIQICSTDGEWGDVITCANTCRGDICTSNSKKVFVTSTTYKGGELGGLAGADAKCQARAAANGLPGPFRAWLSDATGSPSTRFTKDGGPFVLVTGATVANNWSGLTSGSLRHAINVTELGTAAPSVTVPACGVPIVWSNTSFDGMLADPGLTCGDWTDSSVFAASWGTTSSQTDWSQSCAGGNSPASGCGALAPLYCFEQ